MQRRKKFNEHVNDHQFDFAKRLHKEGRVMMADDEISLAKAINEISSRKLTNTKSDISYSLNIIKQVLQKI